MTDSPTTPERPRRVERAHSYVMEATEAAFDALPVGQPGPPVGDLSADYQGGLVIRRRETAMAPGDCVVAYPVVLVDTA